jgi:signal transduction histidine kinase
MSAVPPGARKARSVEAPGDAGRVIHDFNNVLTRLLGASEQLVETLSADPGNRELAGICLEGAERSRLLLAQLRGLMEPGASAREPVACGEALGSVAGFVRRVARDDVALEVVVEPGVACLCDRTELERVLVLLVLDALAAQPPGGCVRLEAAAGRLPSGAARMVGLPGGAFVELRVRGEVGEVGRAAAAEFARRNGGGVAASDGEGASVALYLPSADGPPLP